MSLTECVTAADVRALAKQRSDWRRRQYSAVKQQLAKPAFVPMSLTFRLMSGDPILTSFGCWIVGKRMREPIIPVHLQNRIKRIQDAVARELGVSVDEMVSQRRTKKPVYARQIAMWFAKEKTVHSYPEIGDRFGGRDHTTVLHAWRKIEKLRHSDPELAGHIGRIAAALG